MSEIERKETMKVRRLLGAGGLVDLDALDKAISGREGIDLGVAYAQIREVRKVTLTVLAEILDADPLAVVRLMQRHGSRSTTQPVMLVRRPDGPAGPDDVPLAHEGE